MKKRLLSTFLALCLVLELLPGTARAAEAASGNCGANGDNVIWVLDSEGTLTISGAGDIDTDINRIPWGKHKKEIKNVSIKYGVTSIGRFAFEGYSELVSVTIPGSVSRIGEHAFGYCNNLTTVNISDGVDSIENYAFVKCTKLTNLTIPDSVTKIGKSAFSNCSNLTDIVLSNSITSIEDVTFDGCNKLSNITIPNGVTEIGWAAFRKCSSLANIIIPDNITTIGRSAFQSCTSLTDIVIPDSVTTLGENAFGECTGLKSVTLPASLDFYNSFAACRSVTSVKLTGTGDMCANTNIGYGSPWFQGVLGGNFVTIEIEEGVTSIGDGAFLAPATSHGISSISIPNSVTSIGRIAFSGCANLTDIIIPNSVTAIGDYAFSGCSGLTNVTISNNVKSIGAEAFENCSGLTSITIPNNVSSLGNKAFYGCTSLEDITIPAALNANVFNGCTSVMNVKLTGKGNMADYSLYDAYRPWYVGSEAGNKITVEIEDGITSIGEYVFRDCSGLTGITIPNTVTTIKSGAFSGCSGLKSITIPDSVTSIGIYAFDRCSNLKDVYFIGSRRQWEAISGNGSLNKPEITIHYTDDDIPGGDENPPSGEIVFRSDDGWSDSFTVHMDEELMVIASVSGTAGLKESDFTWSSSNEAIAAVAGAGALMSDTNASVGVKITGVTPGTAIVTLTLTDGRSASCEVKVQPKVGFPKDSHIVSIDASDIENAFIQKELKINIFFDRELDIDATNEANGYMELWGEKNGKMRLLRKISTKGVWDYYQVYNDSPTCVEITMNNKSENIWNNEFNLNAIPYDYKIYLSMTPDSIIFKDNDTIFPNIRKEDGYIATTRWGLTTDIDFLSFMNGYNTASNPFGGFSTNSHYSISKELYRYLLSVCSKTLDLSGIMLDINTYFAKWGGSCWGMCSVMGLDAINAIDLRAWDEGAQNCADLTYPVNSRDAYGTQDLINYYQFLQNRADYPMAKATKNSPFDNWNQVIGDLINKSKDMETKKTPIILYIVFRSADGKRIAHNCLAYKAKEEIDKYTLILYDPSYPRETTVLLIGKVGYNVSLSGGWGQNCNVSTLGYIDPHDLNKYNIDSDARASKQSTAGYTMSPLLNSPVIEQIEDEVAMLLCSIAGDFTVTDSSGRYVRYSNDTFTGDMDVKSIQLLGEGESALFRIEVPTNSSFTYVSEDGASNFAVYQNDNYLQALTQAGNLTVNIEPGKSVTLSGKSNNLSYQLFASSYSDGVHLISIEGETSDSVTAQYTTDKQRVELVTNQPTDVKVSTVSNNGQLESNIEITHDSLVISTTPISTTYKIAFAPNGGVGIMPTATATEGKAFILPACTFTAPAGKEFKAWSINGAEYAPGTSYIFTSDTEVTAVWQDTAPAPEHTHIWETSWSCDKTHHWKECSTSECPIKENSSKKEYGEHTWDKEDGTVCSTCEYQRAVNPPRPTVKEETYYISISSMTNGDIIPNTRYASPGERVTLTAHPGKGYKLDTITVTDIRGRTLALRELSGNSYSFTMPDNRVTVNASFARIEDSTSSTSTPAEDEPFTGLGTPGISGIVLNPASMPFTDVRAGDWFYDSVDYVWKHYLMSGVSGIEFSPNTTTSRAMIWTVLARMNNVRTEVNPGSNWYERGMLWAMEQGITDGSNPMGDITREQLATMLWRNAGSPSAAADLSRFSDSGSVSDYAKSAVNWDVANGILNGSDGKLNPKGTATRAQVAAMVMRYGERIGA